MKILFGTGNKTRLEFLKGILRDLTIELVSLKDESISHRADETGRNPEDNSRIKANEYYDISGLPTFSIDAGLYINKFKDEEQPGVFVKRIVGKGEDVSDEEMLEYYVKKLEECGGVSEGCWKIAITFMIDKTKSFSTVFERKTFFTSKKSIVNTNNEPLNSIQIDQKTGKCLSELTVEEKIDAQKEMVEHIRDFFSECLRDISVGSYDGTKEFWNNIFDKESAKKMQDKFSVNKDLEYGLRWLAEGAENVLDYGCGNGSILLIMDKLNKEIKKLIGIDISEKAVQIGKENIILNKLEHKGYMEFGGVGSLKKYKKESFDRVILSNIIDNVIPKDTTTVLSEIDRILVSNGKILVKVNPYIEHETMIGYGAELIEPDFYLEKEGLFLRNLKTDKWVEILEEYFVIEEYKDVYYDEHDQYNRMFLLKKE